MSDKRIRNLTEETSIEATDSVASDRTEYTEAKRFTLHRIYEWIKNRLFGGTSLTGGKIIGTDGTYLTLVDNDMHGHDSNIFEAYTDTEGNVTYRPYNPGNGVGYQFYMGDTNPQNAGMLRFGGQMFAYSFYGNFGVFGGMHPDDRANYGSSCKLASISTIGMPFRKIASNHTINTVAGTEFVYAYIIDLAFNNVVLTLPDAETQKKAIIRIRVKNSGSYQFTLSAASGDRIDDAVSIPAYNDNIFIELISEGNNGSYGNWIILNQGIIS